MSQQSLVFYITGASKGLGKVFTQRLLEKGHKVAATSRDTDQLKSAITNASDDAFLPLKVDLVNEQSVSDSLAAAVAKFGRIDVVINNAGFGIGGTTEEMSDSELRQNFDINFFGLVNVLRNVAPILRKQASGFVLNISSIAGFVGHYPGFGAYCATKFAVDGITEGYAAELQPFGVRVATINPGYFRTDFLRAESFLTTKIKIDAYEAAHKVEEVHRTQVHGNQQGDPAKLLDVILHLVQNTSIENVPLHLFVGPDAHTHAKDKIARLNKDLDTWETLAKSTNHDDVVAKQQ
ncbi:hypothetical protein SAMD00019534_049050 [Acytostelium subglobosum LB1]|uniref:hypothetical protein n=1 Tax=Acytostelium subglobosum LB1 TaxID=1410327 RepID=UPI0006451D23|nr:hypothetical protein SAMD00019534_049050 [Acytostelium subglobosum LB1]GAM21730.1 hypothetical protein SAMD00019534_049050 [Acytostelium subglobosum LB1]|eukprot:XP_012754830.1 hypothetical protein SAMD00019534_049050 [Acytostelium subglobosum LB1]